MAITSFKGSRFTPTSLKYHLITFVCHIFLSFGLVTGAGNLTNAGALFADDCPLWQSRLYCTRWDGKEKGDAINDAEFTGNVLMLLREAMNFVKSNTKRGWEKLPDGR